ncbi:MAG: putative porin [Pseudomonadales bacterium]|nr:putative porin [Pseudomonadales bacterium]
MNALFGFFAVLMSLGSAGQAIASDSTELDDIRRELVALVSRVAALEAENAALKLDNASTGGSDDAMGTAAKGPVLPAPGSDFWTDNIILTGDFRYRYESLDVQGSADQERNRLRARIRVQAAVSDGLKLIVGLASGSVNPLSSNQSLGGAGSTKDLGLDLAYLQWSMSDLLTLRAGKFKNVWFKPEKSELLWDNDYNPEGFAVSYRSDAVFVHGALNWLESDTKKDQSFVIGLQGGLVRQLGEAKVTAGLGYYELAIAGRKNFFGGEDYFGNSHTCSGNMAFPACGYHYDYEQFQVFAQAELNLGGSPVVVFAEQVQNLAIETADKGWAAGFRLGKAKRAGSWQFGYRYNHLEADAVFGLTSSSDFAGGGTNARGHIFKGDWAVSEAWMLAVTLFSNEQDITSGSRDYRRIQVDTQIKF